MKNIIQALIKSQKEIKNASKDAKNPHFRNDYATLESVIDAVKDIANSNDIVIVQTQNRDEKGEYVETVLYHSSGESISSRCYLIMDKITMQALGSAITYARRYNLASIFCITQADDDGNSAFLPKQEYVPKKTVEAPIEKVKTALSIATKGQTDEQKKQFLKDNLKVESFSQLAGRKDQELMEMYYLLSKKIKV